MSPLVSEHQTVKMQEMPESMVRKRAPHYCDIHLDILMNSCAIFENTNNNTNNFYGCRWTVVSFIRP